MNRGSEKSSYRRQTASDAISILSGRLVSSTLLEDRRAAILGLRSFSKDYPASVSSCALRGLVSCLNNDSDDVDTIKLVLETLLALAHPNEKSPEASDDISLWLADEFTQRPDNIPALLHLIDSDNFFVRLYSIQIITAVSNARPSLARECIMSTPLGTSRLVKLLKDDKEPIRDAGVVLLINLTSGSSEFQKLVAFEGTFESIISLVKSEGSIYYGGVVVQDCLSLLANLIRFNASNQALFRESDCMKDFCSLLKDIDSESDNQWQNELKDKNLWGLLAVIRMFLSGGSSETSLNQNSFTREGLLESILNEAFKATNREFIRSEAFYTCADMIRSNGKLLESFAQIKVRKWWDVLPNSKAPYGNIMTKESNTKALDKDIPRINVVKALLELTLGNGTGIKFSERYAAAECIKSFVTGDERIKNDFVEKSIEEYEKGEGPSFKWNCFAAGFTRLNDKVKDVDPFYIWFGLTLIMWLISDDVSVKERLLKVKDIDCCEGEEEVTLLQHVSGMFVWALQRDGGRGMEREVMAYLMLICVWVYESHAAVNQFLSEGSAIRVLMYQASKELGNEQEMDQNQIIIRGLCAFLLGIIYEFSTKDSVIPRSELRTILHGGLGREKYSEAIRRTRNCRIVREYEVRWTGEDIEAITARIGKECEEVFVEGKFIEFFKDNYGRILRSIDSDASMEIHSISDKGVDRNIIDMLRQQLDESKAICEVKTNEFLKMKGLLEGQIEDLRMEINDLKRIRSNLEQQVLKAERMYLQSQQDNQKLSLEHNGIREQLLTLQQNQGTTSELEQDFDRLLLVLGDVEEKRKRDKAILKEMGREVSEDEDDEDSNTIKSVNSSNKP